MNLKKVTFVSKWRRWRNVGAVVELLGIMLRISPDLFGFIVIRKTFYARICSRLKISQHNLIRLRKDVINVLTKGLAIALLNRFWTQRM